MSYNATFILYAVLYGILYASCAFILAVLLEVQWAGTRILKEPVHSAGRRTR